MYQPLFDCTSEMKSNLSDVDSCKDFILSSLIQPKIDISLKMNAITQSVYASTVDEEDEEPLSYNDVKILIRCQQRLIRKKKEKKALNYYKVLKKIEKYHENGNITNELLLKLHKDITKGLIDDPQFEGSYRNSDTNVRNLLTGKIRYTPPEYSDIHELMKDLIEWINSSHSLHPVIVAGIAHYEIVRIHPFVNGNGRTARALACLILCLRSFDINKYFSLDEHYNVNKTAYVDALKTADDSSDLTEWLEYFTEGVLLSVNEVFKMISELPTVDEPVELTLNQLEVSNYVFRNEKITRKETEQLLDLTQNQASKILKDLQNMEILKKEGSGPATFYVFDID